MDSLRKTIRAVILEALPKEQIPGGLSAHKSLQNIADKHGVELDDIKNQLEKGIKVEMEHTKDSDIAREIAKDHLMEDPAYYDKLEKMEER